MITFNSIASTTSALDIISVMRVYRPISPGHQARIMDITGMDGVIYQAKDRRPLYITCRIALRSASYTAKRAAAREIAAWLDTDELAPLVFDDESDKRYMAVVLDEIDVEEIALLGKFDVTFFVPSGYAESTTTKTTSPNEGTAETPCIITVTMTADDSSLKITLDETGEFILLNHDLYEEKAETQTLYLGGATGGTFTIGKPGDTATLDHDVSAATLEAALEGIYGAGNVTVTAGTDFLIEVVVAVGESDLEASFTNLTGATDPTLTIDQAYSVADTVVIDTNLRTVTVNTVDARADVSYLSDFFKLPVGTFTLTPDPASTVEVEYRERWK